MLYQPRVKGVCVPNKYTAFSTFQDPLKQKKPDNFPAHPSGRCWNHTVVTHQNWACDRLQTLRIAPIHHAGFHRNDGTNGIGD